MVWHPFNQIHPVLFYLSHKIFNCPTYLKGYFHLPRKKTWLPGEDVSYPACELNSQGPAARGWRSAGAPPHELLLRLGCVASVHKLQLLAHHQLIREYLQLG